MCEMFRILKQQVLIKNNRAVNNLYVNNHITFKSFKHYFQKTHNKMYRNQSYMNGLVRLWDDTEFGCLYRLNPSTSNGIPFMVMSFNILAQKILEFHEDMYSTCDPTCLMWENRLQRIVAEIHQIKPQILCLQEVQEDHFQKISAKLMHLNYKSKYFKRTGSKVDGCAIFYNKFLFNLERKKYLKLYRTEATILNRDNVAILLKLSLKSNPCTSFVISTTHLLYNPKREDVRLAQLQLILAELEDFSKVEFENEIKRCPIIIVGDFNFSNNSSLFDFVTRGITTMNGYSLPKSIGISNRSIYEASESLPHKNEQCNNGVESFKKQQRPENEIKHNLNLTSTINKDVLGIRATTFHKNWIAVDHIFYSDNVNPKLTANLELLTRYMPPLVQDCYKNGPLPNHKIGSDHYSIAACFLIH